MKKTVLLSIVMVLALSMAITGSIAYLSDTDSDVNVMTLGNVKIEQVELQRAEGVPHNAGEAGAGNGVEEGDLVPFQQGKKLYPAYPVNNEVTDYSAEATDLFYWGDYVYTGTAGNGLWNDAKLKGALDKMVFVKNTGKSDCYFRTWIAFECPEGMEYSEGPDKEFMNNVNGGETYNWEDVGYITIDDVQYAVTCATYQRALPAGAQSHPSLLQVVMTHNATNEDMELLGDTYEILAFTQAVQTENFKDIEGKTDLEKATIALDAAFGAVSVNNLPWKAGDVEKNKPIIIDSEEEFKAALKDLTDAGSGSNTIHLAKDMDLSNIEWTPIKVDGYHGADIITVEGNGHVIKGLKAPLFAGGFAGGSGIVIKNLTIADSQIVTTNSQGAGAFIECADSMDVITLINCHLIDSTLTANTANNESRMGGLVGWTAGYNNQNDGPVKSYVTIEKCSVVKCNLSCAGSIGGIIGHSGGNAWTFTTVKDCIVKDCEFNSSDKDDWRVGVVVGTANVGEMTIEGITESGNTLTQTGKTAPDGQRSLYGRFVPGTTGKLVIDGTEITLN
ncbi:MAG: hypothetical protein IJD39_06935 [Clostridia bacterium]|nr:hypothetical protein [Clostridia bacterium]